MTAPHFQSATALAQLLRDGRLGARELLEHYLARIDRFKPSAQRSDLAGPGRRPCVRRCGRRSAHPRRADRAASWSAHDDYSAVRNIGDRRVAKE